MQGSARSLWRKVMVALIIVLLLQLLFGATVSSACTPTYHKVRRGETLSSIARLYGVSVWAIAQANGIANPNVIYACQVLLIPCAPQWRPCPWPKPWPGRVHIVQYGETLTGIAWRYGTTVWAICRANGIWNKNLIYVGQRLNIP